MDVNEFRHLHMHVDGNEVFDAECVHKGGQEIEQKTVYQTSVYRVGEEYFEVVSSWSNSGYWSDGERYAPEVRKVRPVKKVVEIIEWVAA